MHTIETKRRGQPVSSSDDDPNNRRDCFDFYFRSIVLETCLGAKGLPATIKVMPGSGGMYGDFCFSDAVNTKSSSLEGY